VMIFLMCARLLRRRLIHSFSFLGGAKPLAVGARLHIVSSFTQSQNKNEAAAGHDNRSRREDEIGGPVFVMCI
jgi:hypothetical protein